MAPRFVLKLYVVGPSPQADQAVASVRRLCEQMLQGRCELSVIDALEQPELAESDHVLVTPTLIKALPLPSRRVVGDFSDDAAVLNALGIDKD
jgi:circadian clock protein KaiB